VAAEWLSSFRQRCLKSTFGGTVRAFCSETKLSECTLYELSAGGQLQTAYHHACQSPNAAAGRICLKGWIEQVQNVLDDSQDAEFEAQSLLLELDSLVDLLCEVGFCICI
jgi:hypothetical protein